MPRRTVPESCQDMWWATKQNRGPVVVKCEVNEDNDNGIRTRSKVSVHASMFEDKVTIEETEWWSCRKESTGLMPRSGHSILWTTNMTFEEFKSSEWWIPYLEQSSSLDFNSSWMDSLSADVDNEGGFALVSFFKPVDESAPVCVQSTNPTNTVVEYQVVISNAGDLEVYVDDVEVLSSTIKEVVQAVKSVELLRERGISVDDDGTVTIKAATIVK